MSRLFGISVLFVLSALTALPSQKPLTEKNACTYVLHMYFHANMHVYIRLNSVSFPQKYYDDVTIMKIRT